MKSKILMLLMAVLVLALTACDMGAVQSLGETGAVSSETEEDSYTVEIPESVKNLTDEQNALLNGELKDGVYINRYFGLKFSVPEGGTLVRQNDGATDTNEVIPLLKAYEEEWGGICISADIEGLDGFFSVFIAALDDDEIGLSEEELIEKNIQEILDINKAFDVEGGPEYRTAIMAGEEHPMSYSVSETEEGNSYTVDLHIPRGSFEYMIFIYVTNEEPENLLQYFEKIPDDEIAAEVF